MAKFSMIFAFFLLCLVAMAFSAPASEEKPEAEKKEGDLQTASSFIGGYGGYGGLYGGYGYGFPYGGYGGYGGYGFGYPGFYRSYGYGFGPFYGGYGGYGGYFG